MNTVRAQGSGSQGPQRYGSHARDKRDCPVCGAGLIPEFTSDRFDVARCRKCHHRIANHQPISSTVDYHEQYDAGGFLDALRATRRRQAQMILPRIRRYAPNATRLLDFGCGRGWFLETARDAGFQVAGADTSALAVQLLSDRGMPAVLLSPEGELGNTSMPFKPHVVTLLDVIEHFPPERVIGLLTQIVSALDSNLQLVVIKVPISDGLLYKIAKLVRLVGIMQPIEQLYQAGTAPPPQLLLFTICQSYGEESWVGADSDNSRP